MKYYTLFLLLGLALAQVDDAAVEDVDMDDVDFEQRRDYTIDVTHLCPNAPDKEALQCEKTFQVSQHVQ